MPLPKENEGTESSKDEPKISSADRNALAELGVDIDEELLSDPRVAKLVAPLVKQHGEVTKLTEELTERGYNHRLVTEVLNNPIFQQFLDAKESGKLESLGESGSSDTEADDDDEIPTELRKFTKALGERLDQVQAMVESSEKRAAKRELIEFKAAHPDWKEHQAAMVAVMRGNPDATFEEAYKMVTRGSNKLAKDLEEARSKLKKNGTVESSSGSVSDDGGGDLPIAGKSYREIAREAGKRAGLL